MNINTVFSVNGLINMVLLIGIAIGGLYATRSGYQKKIMESQKATIEAFQVQIVTLTDKISALSTEISNLKVVQETIVAALDKKDIKVTIDGDMVTIVDRNNSSSSMRRRPAKQQTTPTTVVARSKTTMQTAKVTTVE